MVSRKWTKEEDAILRKHLPEHGAKWDGWAELLPGRTYDAICCRRRKIHAYGVATDAGRRYDVDNGWTEKQREALMRIAEKMETETGHSIAQCVLEHQRMLAVEKRRKNYV